MSVTELSKAPSIQLARALWRMKVTDSRTACKINLYRFGFQPRVGKGLVRELSEKQKLWKSLPAFKLEIGV